ncbi:hypothetical protein BC830DRAFT_104582 [Chytriomyces sp. MP71]|nr:hypothetical protein BC830DRAFT_104582 [Chytriomyces sp. MP71]
MMLTGFLVIVGGVALLFEYNSRVMEEKEIAQAVEDAIVDEKGGAEVDNPDQMEDDAESESDDQMFPEADDSDESVFGGSDDGHRDLLVFSDDDESAQEFENLVGVHLRKSRKLGSASLTGFGFGSFLRSSSNIKEGRLAKEFIIEEESVEQSSQELTGPQPENEFKTQNPSLWNTFQSRSQSVQQEIVRANDPSAPRSDAIYDDSDEMMYSRNSMQRPVSFSTNMSYRSPHQNLPDQRRFSTSYRPQARPQRPQYAFNANVQASNTGPTAPPPSPQIPSQQENVQARTVMFVDTNMPYSQMPQSRQQALNPRQLGYNPNLRPVSYWPQNSVYNSHEVSGFAQPTQANNGTKHPYVMSPVPKQPQIPYHQLQYYQQQQQYQNFLNPNQIQYHPVQKPPTPRRPHSQPYQHFQYNRPQIIQYQPNPYVSSIPSARGGRPQPRSASSPLAQYSSSVMGK